MINLFSALCAPSKASPHPSPSDSLHPVGGREETQHRSCHARNAGESAASFKTLRGKMQKTRTRAPIQVFVLNRADVFAQETRRNGARFRDPTPGRGEERRAMRVGSCKRARSNLWSDKNVLWVCVTAFFLSFLQTLTGNLQVDFNRCCDVNTERSPVSHNTHSWTMICKKIKIHARVSCRFGRERSRGHLLTEARLRLLA